MYIHPKISNTQKIEEREFKIFGITVEYSIDGGTTPENGPDPIVLEILNENEVILRLMLDGQTETEAFETLEQMKEMILSER